jgi:ADP-ribose pyrophosphatase YjhB (NUDIX family)
MHEKINKERIIGYVSTILITQQLNENYDGRPFIWLSKRINPNKPMYGWYNCPGGHLNTYETVEQCLTRELEEETGIIVTQASERPIKIGTIVVNKNKNRE